MPTRAPGPAVLAGDDRGHTEAPRESFRQRAGAYVDRQVATPRKRVEAEVPERNRNTTAGMVTDEKNRGLCERVDNIKR